MLTNRRFQVFMGDKKSRWRISNDGLPQGSVLAPTLFNLYIHDLPITSSFKFQYADDIALAYQCNDMDAGSEMLTKDLKIMSDYFYKWRLNPNPSKTEVCAFHLYNRQADRELQVQFNNTIVNHNLSPKYLGVTLDRSLTFKKHLENLQKKVRSRINLLHKLAGTGWGSDAHTLRIAYLALVYSTAEYCSSAWLNSNHVKKIDVQLNSVMRVISGALKSTPLGWLPVLSNISPPDIRRKQALVGLIVKQDPLNNSMLSQMLCNAPQIRLKSRKPPWITAQHLILTNFNSTTEWRTAWNNLALENADLVVNPTQPLEGFKLPR